ncbi:MAG: aminopeptidase P family protein [Planctomycetales bacterium]|nr:aminopeptidase P family protein [Planctomycetales bacterium]
MTDTYRQRRQRLLDTLASHDCDAMLVTKYVNVTYLTGFTGDSSYLLLTADRAVILSDTRYDTQLENECPGMERVIRDAGTTMKQVLERETAGVRRLGIEADSLTWAQADEFKEAIGAELAPTTGLLDRLREVKDEQEVAAIRRSIALAEESMRTLHQRLHPEMTELEMAAELEYIIRQGGGQGCSFPPILAVGSNAALPHASPTSRRLKEHPVLLTDWGATRDHYLSDLTRVWMTDKITPEIETVYGVVLTAQQRAIDCIRPGALMTDVDQAARATIRDAGYGPYFGHGLGHGFGLEIHEQPRLAPPQPNQPPRALEVGMVVTVEPGIYLPGQFGVRIEDDILVTPDGHEVLSSIPKALDACRLQVA